MKDSVPRTDVGIAAAIVSDSQNFLSETVFLENCRDAARKKTRSAPVRRLDSAPEEEPTGVDDPPKEESWTNNLADKAWKICHVLRHELMQTRLISLIVEWCETEHKRKPAVCYNDICFRYDHPNAAHHIEVVKKGPENNCYVHIPHSLLDPVLQANVDRLQKFYQQTFWCNFQVFQCFQAAIALAKRGLNIDRCFIGISPGGVGQSLYSLHLSEMYKHNHSFFDPNIWHLDEELRKQVESFAKCFIITGQEAPESSKKLHIDLFKKTMSADGIMGRKPYGYTTRMFHIVGWKRLELNRMMTFSGVNISNFHSMFRRAFVWKAKARFVHSKFLLHYPDHEEDGIFAADPSLNKFLQLSQASIAGHRCQWVFERENGCEACYQFIEDYCNGGDQYLTEDTMRGACGIPVRQRRVQDEHGLGFANLLEADAESQKHREEQCSEWDNLRNHLLDVMLEAGTELMSYYEFKKLPFKNVNVPNVPKDKLWDEVEPRSVLRSGIVRHKTSKAKPGVYFPFMTFSKNFDEIISVAAADDARMLFEEQHNLHNLRQYAFAHASRKSNVECLQKYHGSMCTSLTGENKKGRKQSDQADALRAHGSAMEKLKDHEGSILSVLHGVASQRDDVNVPKRRRLRDKDSLQEPQHCLEDSQAPAAALTSKQITYRYSAQPAYSVKSRRYGGLGSAQSMSRRLQLHVLDGHSADLDIQNCCLSLTCQIVQKLNPVPPLPTDLSEMLYELAHRRDEFIEKLNLCRSEGKELVNTLLNGGRAPNTLKDNVDVQKVQKLSLYLRWMACNLLYADYMSLKDVKAKKFPSSTIFSLMWQAVEDRILQCWSEFVLRTTTPTPSHLSLHFDGLRISKCSITNMNEYCLACEKEIEEKLDFKVKIVEKQSKDAFTAMRQCGSALPRSDSVPDACVQPGNCIPCALWHVAPLLRTTIATSLQSIESKENKEALERGCRSYRSAVSMNKADLNCAVGLPPDHVECFMLHSEASGRPHCVAVKFSPNRDFVSILDGRESFKLTTDNFKEAVASAVDCITVVSYWQRQSQESLHTHADVLLDILAGASSDQSDDEGDMLPSLSASRIEFDSEGCPFVSDNILEYMKKEVQEVTENLRSSYLKVDGRRGCPFCPFRSFACLRYLRTHVAKYHCAERQFIAAGTKQVKVVLALYDHAASSQAVPQALLRESAALLRNMIEPPLPHSINNIDKQIRLVFDGSGPAYVNVAAIGDTIHARRVRNLYYTRTFADLLLREMIMSHAQENLFDSAHYLNEFHV